MSPSARWTFLGFESAAPHLKNGSVTKITGNPVRATITQGDRFEAAKYFDLDQNKKTILIFGGSQGARAINRNILSFLNESELPENIQLLWQIGKRDYKEVAAQAGSRATGCALLSFVERMDLAYAMADIAIARAGALTLAELAACCVPSILVPYPHAAEDHQRHNAEDFVRQGTALMIEEKELGSVSLIKRAVESINSGERDGMARAAAIANQDKVPAVDVIAEEIIKIVTERTGGEAGD
jgi:UDP-N-acetylglucosamine--N-acetylmuramyl-(pentapeptide) pyrophosphoryl-undecaprenol N-acetylglucosamine transferase